MDFKMMIDYVGKEIERLNDLDVEDMRLNREIDRGNAIAQLSKNYVRSMAIALQTERFKAENVKKDEDLPSILRIGD